MPAVAARSKSTKATVAFPDRAVQPIHAATLRQITLLLFCEHIFPHRPHMAGVLTSLGTYCIQVTEDI